MGRFRGWVWINKHMVCRKCGARLNCRPYCDPWRGGYDHSLFVCSGHQEHPIREEGDLEAREQREWLEEHQQWQKVDVMDAYGLKPEIPGKLYVDPDFEGLGDLPPKEQNDADQATAR